MCSRAYLTNTGLQRKLPTGCREQVRVLFSEELDVTLGDYLASYWHFWHHLNNQKDFFSSLF